MADKLHRLFGVADGIHIVHAWDVVYDEIAHADLGSDEDVLNAVIANFGDEDVGKVARLGAEFYLLTGWETGTRGGEGPDADDEITFGLWFRLTSPPPVVPEPLYVAPSADYPPGPLWSLGTDPATLLGYSAFAARADHGHELPDLSSKADKHFTLLAYNQSEHTFVADAVGKLITSLSAAPFVLKAPTNALVAIPVGAVVSVLQLGAGQVTIGGMVGVTLRTSSTLKTRAQYSQISLIKIAANEWVVSGDLAAL